MHVEAFHRVIKYIYLQDKHNRRLDVCLFQLIKFNRDKIFERCTKQTKGKLTHKSGMIHQRHKESLLLKKSNISSTSEKLWIVKSENRQAEYNIEMVSERCTKECKIKCCQCQACSHMFSCKCMDFLTKNIPCKHIILIATMLALETEKHLNKDGLDTKSEQPFDSLDATLSFIDGSKPIRTDELKDRITRNLLTLIETTKNDNDEARLVQLDMYINTAKHTFSALLKHKCDAIPVLQ
eukprot:TCONS_00060107-protein